MIIKPLPWTTKKRPNLIFHASSPLILLMESYVCSCIILQTGNILEVFYLEMALWKMAYEMNGFSLIKKPFSKRDLPVEMKNTKRFVLQFEKENVELTKANYTLLVQKELIMIFLYQIKILRISMQSSHTTNYV